MKGAEKWRLNTRGVFMAKKKIVKAVSACPRCRSKDLLAFDGDHFCLGCSWDSLEMSVERGDLDEAIYDFEDSLARKGAASAAHQEPAIAALIVSSSDSIDGSAA
jgi:hypothetical protein